MLSSFADLVALNPHPFSRPVLKADGPLVIKAGRHPVISSLAVQQLTSSFVANDLFMSPLDNMHIITGPNGAGKTVYIKQVFVVSPIVLSVDCLTLFGQTHCGWLQVALIVVLAQIGCMVPARHATIPLRDRI